MDATIALEGKLGLRYVLQKFLNDNGNVDFGYVYFGAVLEELTGGLAARSSREVFVLLHCGDLQIFRSRKEVAESVTALAVAI